jgi:hypothetical protein
MHQEEHEQIPSLLRIFQLVDIVFHPIPLLYSGSPKSALALCRSSYMVRLVEFSRKQSLRTLVELKGKQLSVFYLDNEMIENV